MAAFDNGGVRQWRRSTMAPVDARKAELRRKFLAARRARPAADTEAARAAVRGRVRAACAERGWQTVAAYVPFGTEPGSGQLLDELVATGHRVLVPVTLPDRDLDWAEWNAGRAGTPLGPDTVAEVDAAIVPALAVATDGTRLGRGGGSYDRALARLRPGTPVVALLHDGELVTALPRDPWDRPVTAVITPSAGWQDVG
jgi:5-formyltetrahydrofolate cyclo-ligase